MSRREKAFLIAFLLIRGFACLCVIQTKGTSQLGNALSFLGGVATLVPPFNQLSGNRKYSAVIQIPTHPDLEQLDVGLEEERRNAFMAFKAFDFILLVGGLLLMSVGFLTSIVTSPNVELIRNSVNEVTVTPGSTNTKQDTQSPNKVH